MEAMAFEKMLEDHENAGVSVITVDCGELTPAKVGELFYFLELSRGICDRMQPAAPTEG